jgi:hypothetical protein
MDHGDAGLLVAGGTIDGTAVKMLDAATGTVVWTVSSTQLMAEVGPSGDAYPINAHWTGPDSWVSITQTHVIQGDSAGEVTRVDKVDVGHGSYSEEPPLLWPDGRLAVVTGAAGGALVDPDRPAREPEELPGQPAAISPDGTHFLSKVQEGVDAVMRIHRTDDLSPVGQDFTVPAVFMGSWSPDGSRLAIGSAETIQIRDGRTGGLLETLSGGHSGAAMQPVFAGPDGSMLWSPGRDGVTTVWDLRADRSMLTSGPAGISSVHGSADLAGRAAVAHQLLKDIPHRAYLLSADTGEVRAELTPEEECMCQPVATAIAPDGSVVVAAFEYYTEEQGPSPLRGFLTVWSADDGTPKQTVDLGLKPMGVATDGRHAVVNGETGYAVVDLRTGTVSVTDLPPVLPRWEIPRPVKISRDGLRAAISRDNVVEVVSLPDGMQVTSRDVSAPDDHFEITAMTWSADGSVIVVGSLGGQLQFLDSDTLEPIAPPRLTVGGFVLNLTVSPDGTMLANTGTDGEARLWDTGHLVSSRATGRGGGRLDVGSLHL